MSEFIPKTCVYCREHPCVRGSLFCEQCTLAYVKNRASVTACTLATDKGFYRDLLSPQTRAHLEQIEARNRVREES